MQTTISYSGTEWQVTIERTEYGFDVLTIAAGGNDISQHLCCETLDGITAAVEQHMKHMDTDAKEARAWDRFMDQQPAYY